MKRRNSSGREFYSRKGRAGEPCTPVLALAEASSSLIMEGVRKWVHRKWFAAWNADWQFEEI